MPGTEAPEETTLKGIANDLLKSAKLWHDRLGHLSIQLLKKTAKIASGMPNFDAIKETEFRCPACDKTKAVRRPSRKPIPDPKRVLDSIEGDTVKIKPFPKNKKATVLFLVDRKARFRWAFLMPNKKGPTVFTTIKGFFRLLRNKYGAYPRKFHFDRGTEVNKLLQSWLSVRGIEFSTSSPYIHEQNGLIERSIRVILDRLRATMIGANLPLYL